MWRRHRLVLARFLNSFSVYACYHNHVFWYLKFKVKDNSMFCDLDKGAPTFTFSWWFLRWKWELSRRCLSVICAILHFLLLCDPSLIIVNCFVVHKYLMVNWRFKMAWGLGLWIYKMGCEMGSGVTVDYAYIVTMQTLI